MKKILLSILIMIILIFCGFEILTESNTILNAVTSSFSIWINNLFPSLFPFFVLSEILINYGFIELIGELFKPIFEKIFKINGNAAFIFFMSIISGFPSNAKYTRELYLQGKINALEASKILMFSHFSNPLFILGTISITFIQNKKLGLIIMIWHYLTNIIIGIIFRNYNPSVIIKTKSSFKKAILAMHEKRINNDKKFGTIITNSLVNSINTLLLILGVVTTFLIITTIIDNNFHLTLFNKTILSGLLEMTQGLKHVSLLSVSINIKAILITMILSFGGLSVHTQIISIISDTDIKYRPFLLARIIHAIIASLLVFITLLFVKI
ncbi:MAG: nucleoside recognition domain-containing protein [Bacilli bacterium]